MVAASTRALLLALTVAGSPAGVPGRSRQYTRFLRRKWAYVATCFFRPEEHRLLGFVAGADGIDVLWQPTGPLRRTGGG